MPNIEQFEAFATLDDLVERWPQADPDQRAAAPVLLDDASQFMVDQVGVDAISLANPRTLRRICCAIVRRALETPELGAGIEQFSETTGPFSHSFKPANPHGDLYLTQAEKRALRGRPTAWSFDPLADRERTPT